MIEVRRYIESDYDTISEWYEYAHGYRVGRELIPHVGFVATDDGRPVLAVMLYEDRTARVAHLRWLAGEPGLSGRPFLEALNKIIDATVSYLKNNGGLYCFHLTSNRGIINTFLKHGFVGVHAFATELVIRVG